MKGIESVQDPTDKHVTYWVAWSAEDNFSANPWRRDILVHRVFRDDHREQHATPISPPMTRAEAYELLAQMELLFKES